MSTQVKGHSEEQQTVTAGCTAGVWSPSGWGQNTSGSGSIRMRHVFILQISLKLPVGVSPRLTSDQTEQLRTLPDISQ